MKPAILLSFLGLAAAVPSSSGLNRRKDGDDDTKAMRLLIGAGNVIAVASYNGESFDLVDNYSYDGVPSWMIFKKPNIVYAVDENSNNLHVLKFRAGFDKLDAVEEQSSSGGVVHLAFNKDQTRMLGSSYGDGGIDVWDISNNSAKLLETLKSENELGPITDRQDQSRPHQAVLDPTGKFFAVNDLGTDTILVIDARDDDKYAIANNHRVQAACGPRHGVFHGKNEKDEATHYTVVCELSNLLLMYTLKYTENTIEFTYAQTISTFGPKYPPKNTTSVAAGAIVHANDDDFYVSNRNTGHPEDDISRFGFLNGQLVFLGSTSSKADNPRMMSLSLDGSHLFVANVDGGRGLHAFTIEENGSLKAAGHADLTGWLEEGKDMGPMFVTEVPTS